MITIPFSSSEIIYLLNELGLALLKFLFFAFLIWTVYEYFEKDSKRRQTERLFESVKDLTIDKFKVWVEMVHAKPSKAENVDALAKLLKDQQEVINKHHEELKLKCEEIDRLEYVCKKQETDLRSVRNEVSRLTSVNNLISERFYDYASNARNYIVSYQKQTKLVDPGFDDYDEEKVVADMLERTDKIMDEFNYLPF
jgi:hypothetical protein